MARSNGQNVVMSVLTAAAGVFILHTGIEMLHVTDTRVLNLGQELAPQMKYQGGIVIGLGIALLTAAAKLLSVAITDTFSPSQFSPEELWEETPISLKSRLHFAVGKGYSRVAVKGGDLHDMMNLPKQNHVRFVGKQDGIVEISRVMSKFIANAPEEEIRMYRTQATAKTPVHEGFWTPQSTVPMPAQNC